MLTYLPTYYVLIYREYRCAIRSLDEHLKR